MIFIGVDTRIQAQILLNKCSGISSFVGKVVCWPARWLTDNTASTAIHQARLMKRVIRTSTRAKFQKGKYASKYIRQIYTVIREGAYYPFSLHVLTSSYSEVPKRLLFVASSLLTVDGFSATETLLERSD